VDTFEADMEGTEIFKPLESIFASNKSNSLEKHIILLTDGCVDDIQKVVNLIEKNNKSYFLHTIGIGSGVST